MYLQQNQLIPFIMIISSKCIRTTLGFSKLIVWPIINGAKLIINHPPEIPLFGRSDRLFRCQFGTKKLVNKAGGMATLQWS